MFAVEIRKHMKTIATSQELGNAIRGGERRITVTGTLAQDAARIIATGAAAWVFAYGAISIGVTAALRTLKSRAGPVYEEEDDLMHTIAKSVCTPAITLWGIPTTIAALKIGLGGNNPATLQTLKMHYRIVHKTQNRLFIINDLKQKNNGNEI